LDGAEVMVPAMLRHLAPKLVFYFKSDA
jgi:hypothetical protein